MAELELKHIFKDYKLENKTKFTALTDINLSFDKGELVSVWQTSLQEHLKAKLPLKFLKY